ncbi:MAG: hypothetical protein ACLR78_06020 [Roseburia sp.]
MKKGRSSLTLTAVNRNTGAQQPEGILGTYEDDFGGHRKYSRERMMTSRRV